MLIVLVGARGAGKSTLQDTLREAGVTVLKPSTTRPPRSEGDDEYNFVKTWNTGAHAWRIEVGEHAYGMRNSELAKAGKTACVTVFEPLNLHVFESVRRNLGVETMTVGLDTIGDLTEQHRRVGDDPRRMMTGPDLDRVRDVVSQCDVVLHGEAETVAGAVRSLIALVDSRGGVVTRDHLSPLMAAGALLVDADQKNIRSASYDLRVGSEILSQGEVVELSESNPRFEIPPYSYAIVSALETANLPPVVIGRFDLKVSFFFEGIILSNGPQVDPGYKGALFCMLYNGSGQPKLLSFGKHFATIDFTTTTSVTEGYKQKYQLKNRMGQFLTDSAITGRGGAIVGLVDDKIAVVDQKIVDLKKSFWAVAAAFVALAVVVPALVVPVAWIEIDKIRTERIAMVEANQTVRTDIAAARKDRDEMRRLLCATPRPAETTRTLCLRGAPQAPQ